MHSESRCRCSRRGSPVARRLRSKEVALDRFSKSQECDRVVSCPAGDVVVQVELGRSFLLANGSSRGLVCVFEEKVSGLTLRTLCTQETKIEAASPGQSE